MPNKEPESAKTKRFDMAFAGVQASTSLVPPKSDEREREGATPSYDVALAAFDEAGSVVTASGFADAGRRGFPPPERSTPSSFRVVPRGTISVEPRCQETRSRLEPLAKRLVQFAPALSLLAEPASPMSNGSYTLEVM